MQRRKQELRLWRGQPGHLAHRGRLAPARHAFQPCQFLGVVGNQHCPGSAVAEVGFAGLRQRSDQVGVIFAARGIEAIECRILDPGHPWADDAGAGRRCPAIPLRVDDRDLDACPGKVECGAGAKHPGPDNSDLHEHLPSLA